MIDRLQVEDANVDGRYKLGAVRFNELLAGAVDEGVRMLVRT